MYFAINEFHWKPSDWLSMTDNEKAFVIASINKRAEAQEKAEKEAKSKARRH